MAGGSGSCRYRRSAGPSRKGLRELVGTNRLTVAVIYSAAHPWSQDNIPRRP